MRCKICLKSFKRTVNKKCWNKYGMCITCCVVKHPKTYPKNIVMMVLAKAELYKSPKNKIYAGKRTRNAYNSVKGTKE
jgi:hypothetical protein